MKKKMVAATMAGLMIFSLAGCSGGSTQGNESQDTAQTATTESETSASEETGDAVTLRLALWDYEVDNAMYDPILEAFQKANPDIKVEIVSSPNADYETKLTTMLSGGDDIDVFFAKSNTALPGIQAKGYCMDLQSMLDESGFDTTNYGTVLEQQMTYGGDVYALPFRTNDWVLFYNKNLFDEAGIDYPVDAMTWQDLETLSEQLQAKLPEGDYAYSFQPKAGFIFPCLAGTEDGFDITTSDLSCMTTALDWILDMQDKGLMQNYADAVSMSMDQTYFYKGEWAMMWNGSWFVQSLNQQTDLGFEWGIAKSPYWEGTEVNGFVTSTPLCISANTKHPEEAFKLLTFMCGEEGASLLAKSNLVPGYMDDTVLAAYKENVNLDENSLNALLDNKTYSFGAPNAVFSQIISAGQKEMELVLTGNETPDEFVDNFTAQRQELIDNAE